MAILLLYFIMIALTAAQRDFNSEHRMLRASSSWSLHVELSVSNCPYNVTLDNDNSFTDSILRSLLDTVDASSADMNILNLSLNARRSRAVNTTAITARDATHFAMCVFDFDISFPKNANQTIDSSKSQLEYSIRKGSFDQLINRHSQGTIPHSKTLLPSYGKKHPQEDTKTMAMWIAIGCYIFLCLLGYIMTWRERRKIRDLEETLENQQINPRIVTVRRRMSPVASPRRCHHHNNNNMGFQLLMMERYNPSFSI